MKAAGGRAAGASAGPVLGAVAEADRRVGEAAAEGAVVAAGRAEAISASRWRFTARPRISSIA